MSKAVPRDHEFDQKAFGQLLDNARGKRSQTEFAKDSGVSTAYMCKYINGLYENPPTPNTIKKIAACASGNVALSDLLYAAGYDPEKYITENNPFPGYRFEKLTTATITNYLTDCRFSWSHESIELSNNMVWNFRISINKEPISQWCFRYIYDDGNTHSYMPIIDNVLICYGSLATATPESDLKVSFVTNSEEVFHVMTKRKPMSINILTSAILVDYQNLMILNEEYLNTNGYDEVSLNRFSLIAMRHQDKTNSF